MKFDRVLLVGLMAIAANIATANLKSETQRQFDKYCRAVKAKDGTGIEKVLRANYSPDFKFVPTKGNSINLENWIRDEKMQVAMTQTVKSDSLRILSLSVNQNHATGKVSLDYQGLTKIDPKGKVGLLHYNSTANMSMQRIKGKWWITEMSQISDKTEFDGKSM